MNRINTLSSFCKYEHRLEAREGDNVIDLEKDPNTHYKLDSDLTENLLTTDE